MFVVVGAMIPFAGDMRSTHGPLLEKRSRPGPALPDPAVSTWG